MRASKFLQILAVSAVMTVGVFARADSTTQCYTAVYDQKTEGTYAFYGKGTWDTTRLICIHATGFTKTFLGKNVTGAQAATSNPYVHVMYVIDRANNRFYAPCGANVTSDNVPGGILTPGVYDLTSFQKLGVGMPNLGDGAFCNISS